MVIKKFSNKNTNYFIVLRLLFFKLLIKRYMNDVVDFNLLLFFITFALNFIWF